MFATEASGETLSFNDAAVDDDLLDDNGMFARFDDVYNCYSYYSLCVCIDRNSRAVRVIWDGAQHLVGSLQRRSTHTSTCY
jgi:hypothetical protein